MKYSSLIFDLDGTLLDTLQDLTASANHALRLHQLPERSLDEVRRNLGNGYARLIAGLVPEGTPEAQQAQILADFNAYYSVHCMDLTHPYEGILPLLEQLKEAGIGMAIVSNKGDVAVQELRERFFANTVAFAVGESETIRRKPCPDALLHAMKLLGSTPSDTLFIGDSEVDIETARRASLPCLSCTWGFRTEDFLRASGATHFVHHPKEIFGFIA